MKAFFVRIVMRDGSRNSHFGMFANGADAVIYALDHFSDVKCVSALRKT
ncbi:hypothetical protein [Variovorax sp.]